MKTAAQIRPALPAASMFWLGKPSLHGSLLTGGWGSPADRRQPGSILPAGQIERRRGQIS